MSNQVQSVTLQTAVLIQVKEFAQNNQTFSVHDITRTIRTKVANGELEIPEVEVSGAAFRYDISHRKVKGLFDELWRTGVFDPDFTLNRQYNGTYFEYTPSSVNAVNIPAPVAPVVTPTPVSVPPQVASPVISLPAPIGGLASSVTLPDKAEVEGRIVCYLNNCKQRNFRPSLKQVQSAIKRNRSTGWSCTEIQDYIQSIGYSVVPNPDFVSMSQVIV